MEVNNSNKFKSFNKVILKYVIFNFFLYVGTTFITILILKHFPKYTLYTYKNFKSFMPVYKNDIVNLLNIFFCNLIVCIISLIVGMIPFLFLPAIICAKNGYALGLALAAYKVHEKSILLGIIFGILPHGIFELVAFFYSFGIGLYVCKSKTLHIIQKKPYEKCAPEIEKAYKFIIIPLLAIAAIIEVFVTKNLILNYM